MYKANLPLIIIATILSIVNISAQENFSIHKFENERYGSNLKEESQFDSSGKDIIPLTNRKNTELTGIVYGFLPDWEYQNGYHNYLKYDLLTHIACFDFMVDTLGNMSNPAGWPWTDLINTAHLNGVKIILTAVTFDDEIIKTLIDDEVKRNRFFNGLKTKVNAYQMDGVNIDFESLYHADKGDRINGFMAQLRSFMDAELPGKELSFATPAINWGDRWKFDGLAESCDHLFIMGYSFYGSWSSKTGPCAPYDGGSNNILSVLNSEYASVVANNPEKIILGVPYYGLHWKTATEYAESSIEDWVSSTRFRNDQVTAPGHGVLWSDKFENPWYKYQDGDEWHQIWYDNFESLEMKYDLAKSKEIAGVGMWALGYDGSRNELWNLLDLKYGSGQLVPPAPPSGFYAKGFNGSTIKFGMEFGSTATGAIVYYKKRADADYDSTIVFTSESYLYNLEPGNIYDIKVKAYNFAGQSDATTTLSTVTSTLSTRVLVVNGVKDTPEVGRHLTGAWEQPLFDNILGFSTCNYDAVATGSINLNEFKYVVWIAGQQSNDVLDNSERNAILNYLKAGKNLLITGSNIANGLAGSGATSDEKEFLNNVLQAQFVSDAPNNSAGEYYSVTGEFDERLFAGADSALFSNGNNGLLNIEKPDVIAAVTPALKFSGIDITAGLQYNGTYDGATRESRLVFLTFPIEAITDKTKREAYFDKIFTFFDNTTNVENSEKVVTNFALTGNYPNPFNPETRITFTLPSTAEVKLNIYSVNGEKVLSTTLSDRSYGYNEYRWTPGEGITSGVYIYTVSYSNQESTKLLSGKMLFLK